MHWRSFVATFHKIRREAPIMLWVLGAFIIGYLGIGYWLFYEGLNYLHHFPLVGSLLSERILFLAFGFFFVMLVFSNLIIGYSTLFRNRETQWMLALPVRHLDVYRWKFFEALAVSSWALIFLSAPLMAAYGRVHQVPAMFYIQVVLVYAPFVVIPALLGSWTVLFIVRIIAKRGVKKAAIFIAAAIVLLIAFGIKPVTETEAVASQEVLSFDQLLKHTRISLNPFLPSAWLAKGVRAFGENLAPQGTFYFLLLLSNAMMGLLLGFEVVGRAFYGSWSVALSSRAERFQRQALAKRQRDRRRSWLECITDLIRPISQADSALTLKDIRLFWRDPGQWIQFMIFFGLLCIYVMNLRNVAINFQSRFWEEMIAHLNLAASALTLSTLTTRFVFPQFSLEGRRLWILGLAPFSLGRVVWQKFWMSFIVSAIITVTLTTASSLMLNLSWLRVAEFAVAIVLMSAALSALAVGLGAVFPNFKEDNPSKIVSGFGGTLCLVASFTYITVVVALVALPDFRELNRAAFPISDKLLPDWFCLLLAVVISVVLLTVPLSIAARRVKNLEI